MLQYYITKNTIWYYALKRLVESTRICKARSYRRDIKLSSQAVSVYVYYVQ